MLLVLFSFLLVLTLFMIFIQDYKDRAVHLFYFITTFALAVVIAVYQKQVLNQIIYSVVFLFLNFLCLKLYFKLKKVALPKDLSFGGLAIGDVVFLIVIIPLFDFYNYLIFFVSGMLFSLILHFSVKLFKKEENQTVPLAGYLALYLLIIIVITSFFKTEIYLNTSL